MSNKLGKIQENARNFELDKIYRNMSPELYKETLRLAVKNATEDLGREYDKNLIRMKEECDRAVRDSIIMAMDTLSVELVYELGNVLECYVDEPDHLDQKIDIVQNIYETAMNSIKHYANYKDDKQAQKEFERKKKVIKDIFGIYTENE